MLTDLRTITDFDLLQKALSYFGMQLEGDAELPEIAFDCEMNDVQVSALIVRVYALARAVQAMNEAERQACPHCGHEMLLALKMNGEILSTCSAHCRPSDERIQKDIAFLTEMRDRLTGANGYGWGDAEMVVEMIGDWIDELDGKLSTELDEA